MKISKKKKEKGNSGLGTRLAEAEC